jgi:hypothetical protein
MDIGLLLGGTYASMAMGLQLQYGVARIMNLANGEVLIARAFGAVGSLRGRKRVRCSRCCSSCRFPAIKSVSPARETSILMTDRI